MEKQSDLFNRFVLAFNSLKLLNLSLSCWGVFFPLFYYSLSPPGLFLFFAARRLPSAKTSYLVTAVGSPSWDSSSAAGTSTLLPRLPPARGRPLFGKTWKYVLYCFNFSISPFFLFLLPANIHRFHLHTLPANYYS